MNLRGAAIHEDSVTRGAALTAGQMRQTFKNLRDLGATITRAHYPLSPYELELADRYGILVWSEIPVYRMKSTLFNRRTIRERALRLLREEITRDYNHPAGDGLEPRQRERLAPEAWPPALHPGGRQAGREARSGPPHGDRDLGLPDGREAAHLHEARRDRAERLLRLVHRSPRLDRRPDALSGYLNRMHSDYPHQAFMVTEVGAEANRHGPVEEKGTYEFQSDFLAYHLNVIASKPFVNGAIVWALHDFRVKPGWAGGNPLPHPPVNEKGLIDDTGFRKPAFDTVRRIFVATGPFR